MNTYFLFSTLGVENLIAWYYALAWNQWRLSIDFRLRTHIINVENKPIYLENIFERRNYEFRFSFIEYYLNTYASLFFLFL